MLLLMPTGRVFNILDGKNPKNKTHGTNDVLAKRGESPIIESGENFQ